ncbi:MAG: hypothetical protein HETSPECPRED_004386 [Heterodermia speciosa]|uniref:Glutathione S-transferase n=1 Tax=Heterodermia speciosa TaxID=116794 RepID=A0A8H3IAI0_9LECA|nr:MAG: hypothetical protein HETSPECPRED_004386 [Heterodermia speciosa]
MAVTFYYAPYSTAESTKAILAELEHGLPNPLATRIELSISAGDTRKPAYLSDVNPNGRVPAIVHDGVPIWESAAITMYLGETFGVRAGNDPHQSSLYPEPGPRRGEAMKWIVWTNTTLTVAGARLAAALPVGTPGAVEKGSQDEVSKDETARKNEEEIARGDLAKNLKVLDEALKERNYLLGDQYCLADTHVWTFVSWLSVMGVSTEEYLHLTEWLARVGARPALKDQ